MGAVSVWLKSERKRQAREAVQRKPERSKEERRAYVKLRREALAAGAKLQNGGRGGLPPSLVLTVFRKAGYACAKCASKLALTVHHIELRPRFAALLKAKGQSNDPSNLAIVCAACHDAAHDKARADGVDSPQTTSAPAQEGAEKDEHHGAD